jgi:hypothetical protein
VHWIVTQVPSIQEPLYESLGIQMIGMRYQVYFNIMYKVTSYTEIRET